MMGHQGRHGIRSTITTIPASITAATTHYHGWNSRLKKGWSVECLYYPTSSLLAIYVVIKYFSSMVACLDKAYALYSSLCFSWKVISWTRYGFGWQDTNERQPQHATTSTTILRVILLPPLEPLLLLLPVLVWGQVPPPSLPLRHHTTIALNHYIITVPLPRPLPPAPARELAQQQQLVYY